jgi:branched-chain amino acid transport system ATP-binding protein
MMNNQVEPQVSLDHLTKRFGGLEAVSKVSLDIQQGELIGLIGPNGAGKTTLVNLLSGNLSPTQGSIIYQGESIETIATYKRVQKGFVKTFQDKRVFGNKSVLENLRPIVRSRADSDDGSFNPIIEGDTVEEEITSLIKFVNLPTDNLYDPAESLPLLARSKLVIALALATDPKLVLLDEPMSGLNRQESNEIENIIQKINRSGRTVLIIEHDIKSIFSLCERVVVLHLGEIIADGAVEDVRQNPDVKEAYIGTKG